MSDLLQRCAMCGVLLPVYVLVLCDGCGERRCGYCAKKHGEDACGQ